MKFLENLFGLQGMNALITGATHGLGMGMAKALGRAGATLIINGHTPDRLSKALEEYQKEGLTAHGYLFDVTNDDQLAEQIKKIEEEVGPIDILVNNAGVIIRKPITDLTAVEFRKVIDINLTGAYLVSRHVGKFMISRKRGKIINICSLMSELGRESVTAYAAAKGGLKMLTRNMATEWASYNIQVNGIGPGYFATEQTEPLRQPGSPFNEFIISRTPAGRWGIPEDLAGAIIFLASKASEFVNGQIIYVDGGLLTSLGKPPVHS